MSPGNTSDIYDWNDEPPRGHPMEPGKWPGTPLYPPAAAPAYTPSKDSPLVVACKRAAAHCGAWPWDPDSWDDAYSNNFAFGVKKNPNKAGMVALQRWSGTLDPTGYVGEKTFNFLRSVLIPQGRTHAGEPAWDAVCVQLTQQANDLVNPPKPELTLRQKALNLAIADLGIKESPPESNICKFSDWYGLIGPWCAMAVSYWYEHAGNSPTFSKGGYFAYVPYIVDDARRGARGLSVTGNPMPGDVVAYNWGGSAGADGYYFDHVGLFEEWTGSHTFYAIEGNTSYGNDSNGGEVMRRSRNVNSQGTVFVRVAEP